MIKKLLVLAAAVLLGVAAIIFLIQQTNTLDTTYFTWQSSRVPPEFEGFRIVQLSDLHNKRFGREQARLVRAIREAAPDLIVLTGDMIDEHARDLKPVQELLAGIHGLAPIYYIDGNHDVRSLLYEDFLALLEQYGVTVLQGQYSAWHGVDIAERPHDTQLERNGAIMTLGSVFGFDGSNAFDPDIVLAHDPTNFLRFAELGHNGLMLAGHNHGGQVSLPNGRAIFGPRLTLWPQFSSGVYIDGDATMFLSRGLGTSRIPFRAFATPEIAIIELKPE